MGRIAPKETRVSKSKRLTIRVNSREWEQAMQRAINSDDESDDMPEDETRTRSRPQSLSATKEEMMWSFEEDVLLVCLIQTHDKKWTPGSKDFARFKPAHTPDRTVHALRNRAKLHNQFVDWEVGVSQMGLEKEMEMVMRIVDRLDGRLAVHPDYTRTPSPISEEKLNVKRPKAERGAPTEETKGTDEWEVEKEVACSPPTSPPCTLESLNVDDSDLPICELTFDQDLPEPRSAEIDGGQGGASKAPCVLCGACVDHPIACGGGCNVSFTYCSAACHHKHYKLGGHLLCGLYSPCAAFPRCSGGRLEVDLDDLDDLTKMI